MITINFAKAQEITKARLREERVPLLAAQDVASTCVRNRR
jgi:hypothetical protein